MYILDVISAIARLEETSPIYIRDIRAKINYKTTAGIFVIAPMLTVRRIIKNSWFHGTDALPK